MGRLSAASELLQAGCDSGCMRSSAYSIFHNDHSVSVSTPLDSDNVFHTMVSGVLTLGDQVSMEAWRSFVRCVGVTASKILISQRNGSGLTPWQLGMALAHSNSRHTKGATTPDEKDMKRILSILSLVAERAPRNANAAVKSALSLETAVLSRDDDQCEALLETLEEESAQLGKLDFGPSSRDVNAPRATDEIGEWLSQPKQSQLFQDQVTKDSLSTALDRVLFSACAVANVDTVEVLVERLDLSLFGASGAMALRCAIASGSVTMCETLLTAGANPMWPTGTLADTAAHIAARRGNSKIFDLFGT